MGGWESAFSILIKEHLRLAGLENGFVFHYLSHIFFGHYHLRAQLDATLGGIHIVYQLVDVAVLDEAQILLRFLVLEEVYPAGGADQRAYKKGASCRAWSFSELKIKRSMQRIDHAHKE